MYHRICVQGKGKGKGGEGGGTAGVDDSGGLLLELKYNETGVNYHMYPLNYDSEGTCTYRVVRK